MRHKYLTLQEVSDLLKLSPSTIYRLARAGKIPSYRFGRQWRFPYGEMVGLTLRRFGDYARTRNLQLIDDPKAPPTGKTVLERMLRGIR